MSRKRPILKLKTQEIIPSEYQETKTFWQWVMVMGFSDDVIKHCNERMGDSAWFIKALYAVGLYKGLLDYQYIVANEKYHGLWLEFKKKDQINKKKPPEQDALIERLLRNGYYATYVYGCDDAINTFNNYINNKI